MWRKLFLIKDCGTRKEGKKEGRNIFLSSHWCLSSLKQGFVKPGVAIYDLFYDRVEEVYILLLYLGVFPFNAIHADKTLFSSNSFMEFNHSTISWNKVTVDHKGLICFSHVLLQRHAHYSWNFKPEISKGKFYWICLNIMLTT